MAAWTIWLNDFRWQCNLTGQWKKGKELFSLLQHFLEKFYQKNFYFSLFESIVSKQIFRWNLDLEKTRERLIIEIIFKQKLLIFNGFYQQHIIITYRFKRCILPVIAILFINTKLFFSAFLFFSFLRQKAKGKMCCHNSPWTPTSFKKNTTLKWK